MAHYHAKENSGLPRCIKEKNHIFEVYVLNGWDIENLQSREIAYLMGMVIKVDQVQKIFDQRGWMKREPVKIYVREDTKPCWVSTEKWIPFPFLLKVKTEQEGKGMIEKITPIRLSISDLLGELKGIETIIEDILVYRRTNIEQEE